MLKTLMDLGVSQTYPAFQKGREAFDRAKAQLATGTCTDAIISFSESVEFFEQAMLHAPRAFMMGSTPEEVEQALALCEAHQDDCSRDWYASESLRRVELTPFEIDPHEVTNERFAQFVLETEYETDTERNGYTMRLVGGGSMEAPGYSWKTPEGPGSSYLNRLDHPVAGMSWNDANAYCRWAKGRLPTEVEWEYAARGANRTVFPWGSEWNAERLHWQDGEAEGTRPVGSFVKGATPEGIHDLLGNVWEWTNTKIDGEAVLKGDSWSERNPANLRAAAQRLENRSVSHVDDGFRCARDRDRDRDQWPVRESL